MIQQIHQKNSYSLSNTKSFSITATNIHQYVAPIDNGIEYIESGTGQPIIFLHGALSNLNTWRKIIPALSQQFRCIALNLPLGGHGIALSKKQDLSPLGIATLINEFISYLCLDKVIIIANDTGGAYAQIFASLYREKTEKLILSNCEVMDVFPPAKFKYLKYAVQVPGFCYLLSNIFQIKPLLSSKMVMGLLSLKLTNEEFHSFYLKNFIEYKDVRENFKRVAQTWSPKYTIAAADKLKNYENPVLILWGKDDVVLFPLKLGYNLKNIFPNSLFISIRNARTYIQEDAPDLMIEEILKFLKQ